MVSYFQRFLNDLWRTRLSWERMIRLLACPFHPSSVSKLSLFFSLAACRRSSLLTAASWVEGGMGEEPNQTTARIFGPLQIIQNSLLLFLLQNWLQSPPTAAIIISSLLVFRPSVRGKSQRTGEKVESQCKRREKGRKVSYYTVFMVRILWVGGCMRKTCRAHSCN
jgi:hypothetical protein